MAHKIDVLSYERMLAKLVNMLLLAASITGTLSYLINEHTVWTQWNSLAHVLTSGAFSVFILPFFYCHFLRTLGFRRAGMLFSGFLLLILFIICAATGWYMTYFGQLEKYAWMLDVHLIVSISFIATLILHIFLHIHSFPKQRIKNTLGRFPSITEGFFRWSFYGNILIQAIIFIATLLYTTPLVPTVAKPATENYLLNYGEHPFRPSQTEVSHGGFVNKEQIGNSFSCIKCHQKIGQQWISSMHQQAASDPAYVTNISLLIDNKGISASRYCEGCHAPVALLTGELSPGGDHGGIEGSLANIEGVSCMSCHGIYALPHIKGVASFAFKPAKYYLFENSDNLLLSALHDFLLRIEPSQHKKDMGNAILKDPKVCAACHTQFMDKDMNAWGWIKMQDEYGAWAASQYSQHNEENFANERYVRCQDCHMPLVDANDPSANKNGKIRSHHFPGASTALPLLRGDKAQFNATKSFLQSNKIRLQIDRPHRNDAIQSLQFIDESLRESEEAPYFYYIGERANLQVVVTNTGVGHNFPAGTIDINEVWIDFSVTDAQGEFVYQSGKINTKNNVDPDAYFYRSIPVDRGGNHVWKHDLFNMVGASFKRFIKAGESDIVNYQFSIPAWVKSPLTVSATIRYRKLNNRYAKWALKDKYFKLPIIDMAWDSLQIPIKIRKLVESN